MSSGSSQDYDEHDRGNGWTERHYWDGDTEWRQDRGNG